MEEVAEGATHWSKRELTWKAGILPTSVHHIWRAFGLQPHKVEEFKISSDEPSAATGPGNLLRLSLDGSAEA